VDYFTSIIVSDWILIYLDKIRINKSNMGTTMCIVHKGFRGFRAVSPASILGGNLRSLKSAIPYDTIHSTLCAIRGIKNRTGPRYSLPTTQSPSLPVKDSFGPFGHRECRKKDPAHKINAPVMPALCARSTPLKSNSPGIRTRAAMTANCTQRRL
jgi:hypothetical protein